MIAGTFRWAPGNKAVWDQRDRYHSSAKTGKHIFGIPSQLMPWNWKKGSKKVEITPIQEDTDRGPCLYACHYCYHLFVYTCRRLIDLYAVCFVYTCQRLIDLSL